MSLSLHRHTKDLPTSRQSGTRKSQNDTKDAMAIKEAGKVEQTWRLLQEWVAVAAKEITKMVMSVFKLQLGEEIRLGCKFEIETVGN